MIRGIKTFKAVSGIRTETGLWIVEKPDQESLEVVYLQLAEITFLCPMRLLLHKIYVKK